MAQERIPEFHNFFDIVLPIKEEIKQQPLSVAKGNLVKSEKSSTLSEEVGPEEHPLRASQTSSVLDESTSAPISDSRDLLPQMDMDALDSSRLFKKSRVEKPDDIKRGHADAATDDLNLTMQPPRILSRSSSLHPSLTSKLDVPAGIYKPWDCTAPASLGMLGPGWTGQKSLHADVVVASNSKDSAASPLSHIPPADEGSRTGLKGSSVASLLNRAMASGPGLSLGRSKSSSRGVGSESTFMASQETAPITRQLTIFYGGQAHVFEDVSSDKAEAIMTLAGSSGRSWSTVYSPQPKSVGMPVSISEVSLSTFERERAQSGSKPSSMNAFENSLGVSTEIHNALSSLLHKTKWATDMQTLSDHIGKKSEGKTQNFTRAAELEKEPFM